MAEQSKAPRTVPDFLIWRCAGCGAQAEGKQKPCDCATNVGTRKGPNGTLETTWWDDPPSTPEMLRQLADAVDSVTEDQSRAFFLFSQILKRMARDASEEQCDCFDMCKKALSGVHNGKCRYEIDSPTRRGTGDAAGSRSEPPNGDVITSPGPAAPSSGASRTETQQGDTPCCGGDILRGRKGGGAPSSAITAAEATTSSIARTAEYSAAPSSADQAGGGALPAGGAKEGTELKPLPSHTLTSLRTVAHRVSQPNERGFISGYVMLTKDEMLSLLDEVERSRRTPSP